MTLKELSEKIGITPRTIRFYISKGLMEGPVGQGRGAYYNDTHLEALQRITELKESGKVISEIKHQIYPDAVELSSPQAIWSYQISSDITVLVKADTAPWRARRIRRAIQELSDTLAEEEEES